MTKNVKIRTNLNYNGEPLKDGEVLVLMPFNEADLPNITNPRSIITVHAGGRYVKAVLKAVPVEFESEAKKQFNAWAKNDLPLFIGRCLIPQPDGSTKPCQRKNGDNRCKCTECPHHGEYNREQSKFVSLNRLSDDFDYALVSSSSPEQECIDRDEKIESNESIEDFLRKLIAKSPKAGYAVLLIALHIEGAAFAEKMKLGHDAANKLRQKISALAAKNVHSLKDIDIDNLQVNSSKHDAYYLAEAQKALDLVMKMYIKHQ